MKWECVGNKAGLKSSRNAVKTRLRWWEQGQNIVRTK